MMGRIDYREAERYPNGGALKVKGYSALAIMPASDRRHLRGSGRPRFLSSAHRVLAEKAG